MNAHRDDEQNQRRSKDDIDARLNAGLSYGEVSSDEQQEEAPVAAGPAPEILTMRERMLYPWLAPAKKITAAKIIILANVLVFVAMAILSAGKGAYNPGSLLLLDWGANFGPLTFGGEYWRIVTCTFVHSGFLHIAMNMAVFNDISRVVERLMGSTKFVIMYFVAGIGGSLLSSLVNPAGISVGASGAVFGVYGALLAFVQMHRAEIPKEVFTETCKGLFAFIILNLVMGFASAHTDNAAHIGGLIFGYLAGLALLNRANLNFPALRQFTIKNAIGTIVLIGLLLGFFRIDELGLFDKDGDLLKARVSQLLEKGKSDQAISVIGAYIASQPNNSIGYAQRAMVYSSVDKDQEAAADVNKAIEINPRDVMALLIRAELSEKRMDMDAALKDEDSAVQIDPTNPKPYVRRAITNRKFKRYREAIADCDSAMNLGMKSAPMKLLKVSILEQSEHLDEALALLNTITTDQEDLQEELLTERIRLLRFSGQFDKLLMVLDDAIRRYPQNADFYDFKGTALVSLGRFDEAMNVFDSGLKIKPLYRIYRDKGIAYLLMNKPEASISQFEKFVQTADVEEGQGIYGVIFEALALERLNKTQAKNALLQKQLQVQVRRWPYPLLLYLNGQLSEAVLVRSIKDRDEMTEAQAYVGLRWLLNGRPQAAVPHFEWVLKNGNVEFLEYELAREIMQGKTALLK